MEKIIVANHKMNLNYKQICDYAEQMKQYKNKIIVCPTILYAPYLKNKGFTVGLQNISHHPFGSYTGEVSPTQAISMGINYVIIGHSERRKIFGETENIINKKIKASLEANLKVILCIGNDNENNILEVIKKQIQESLSGITKEVIIAYEPTKAIGSGKIPSPKEIKQVIDYIKSLFNYPVKVLYGGSVNKNNIYLLKQLDVDGFLIGTSSIEPEKLIKIIKAVS